MRRFLPRVVSVLCAIESLVILLCYMMTRALQRAVENFGTPYCYSQPWPAKLLLFMGPWLFLIPLVWGVSAILFADVEGGIAEVSERHTRVGYAQLIVTSML
jgi:hypothetical protein